MSLVPISLLGSPVAPWDWVSVLCSHIVCLLCWWLSVTRLRVCLISVFFCVCVFLHCRSCHSLCTVSVLFLSPNLPKAAASALVLNSWHSLNPTSVTAGRRLLVLVKKSVSGDSGPLTFNSIQFNSTQLNSVKFNSIQLNAIKLNSSHLFYRAQQCGCWSKNPIHFLWLKAIMSGHPRYTYN